MILGSNEWSSLLARIKAGKCTPFLGAGVNAGILPLGGEIAKTWATAYDFPLDNTTDLAKVAQFLAVQFDASRPKEMILDNLDQSEGAFNFNDESAPLNVLAKLPFKVYITTNYDHLLFKAIEHHGRSSGRKPSYDFCRWSEALRPTDSDKKSFEPTQVNPLIYHLHGEKFHPDSIVLTEDDYLDFLIRMSRSFSEDRLGRRPGEAFLPPHIQEAITGSSILFVGYSLADIDFKVLFRALKENLPASSARKSVAVQFPYHKHPKQQKVEGYLTQYFDKTDVHVFWGDAKRFAQELWDRWKEVEKI